MEEVEEGGEEDLTAVEGGVEGEIFSEILCRCLCYNNNNEIFLPPQVVVVLIVTEKILYAKCFILNIC